MVADGPVIGVDIGGTKVLALALDPLDGRELGRRRVPTPGDAGDLVTAVAGAVAQLQAEVGPCRSLGLGVPGLVDRSGVLRYGPNLPGMVGLDLVGPLAQRFAVPVAAENDAACAALAEHRIGAARGTDHAVVITQGTGIGGGIIVDGRLLRGANGFAGEPGHVLVDPAGPPCACGVRGHWEAVASGTGLANLARALVAEGRGLALVERAGGDPAALRGEHVGAGIDAGDPDAVEVLDRFARWVAAGIGGLVALFDPQVVVLGGGLVALSGRFLGLVHQALPAAVVGWAHRPPVPVVAAQLGPEAGAIGAALVGFDSTVA